MRTRTPESSRVEMTQIVMPTHTNGVGGVLFGGTLVQWIDVCAAVAAMRHCGGAAVTASIDRLDFLVPIHVGDIVVLQAQVNDAARTSMEVGCRVETENPRTGKRRYTTKAYLTFVATDANGRPRPFESPLPPHPPMSWGPFPVAAVCCGIFSLDMKRLVSLGCSHPKGSSYH